MRRNSLAKCYPDRQSRFLPMVRKGPENRRLSIGLGPGWNIGVTETSAQSRYPGSSALPEGNPLGDNEFTTHFARRHSSMGRLLTRWLISALDRGGWRAAHPNFPYKFIWYASLFPQSGLYQFAYEPYLYALVRRICTYKLDSNICSHPRGW